MTVARSLEYESLPRDESDSLDMDLLESDSLEFDLLESDSLSSIHSNHWIGLNHSTQSLIRWTSNCLSAKARSISIRLIHLMNRWTRMNQNLMNGESLELESLELEAEELEDERLEELKLDDEEAELELD